MLGDMDSAPKVKLELCDNSVDCVLQLLPCCTSGRCSDVSDCSVTYTAESCSLDTITPAFATDVIAQSDSVRARRNLIMVTIIGILAAMSSYFWRKIANSFERF